MLTRFRHPEAFGAEAPGRPKAGPVGSHLRVTGLAVGTGHSTDRIMTLVRRVFLREIAAPAGSLAAVKITP